MKKSHIFLGGILIGFSSLGLALILFCELSCAIKEETFGQFGEFYGGVFGTLFAGVVLYFVYQTYISQDNQLDIAKKDADLNIISRMYDNLIEEINSVQYRKRSDEYPEGQIFNGMDAFYNFDESHTENPNSVLNHLQSILIAFEDIIKFANRIKYKYADEKDMMLTRIYFLYYEKIIWSVYQNLYTIEREKLIQDGHPGAENIFERYGNLCAESYKFLLVKNYIGMTKEPPMIKLLMAKDEKYFRQFQN